MQDEINRLKKQVSFFKTSQTCQECGSQGHSTSACTNIEQVKAAETYAETNYMRGQYRNQTNNFADRNNNYPTWGNYNQGQVNAPPSQERRPAPYRPPGYQEPPAWVQGLHEGINGVNNKIDGVRADLSNQMKRVQTQLGELETWRKNVNSQLRNLTAQIPRPQGQLPGHPDQNPRGQIAAVHLRSGRKLPEQETPKEIEQRGGVNEPDGHDNDPGSLGTDPTQVGNDLSRSGKSPLTTPLSVTTSLPTPLGSVMTPLLYRLMLLSSRLNLVPGPLWPRTLLRLFLFLLRNLKMSLKISLGILLRLFRA